MPAPPSTKQKEANQKSMDAARQATSGSSKTTKTGAGYKSPAASPKSGDSTKSAAPKSPAGNSGDSTKGKGVSTPGASGSPVNNPVGISKSSSRAIAPSRITTKAPEKTSSKGVHTGQQLKPAPRAPMVDRTKDDISRLLDTIQGKPPVSQAPVMRQQMMGKPLIRPASRAEPDPRFNVGVIDTPRLAADPANFNKPALTKPPSIIAPGSADAQYLANQYRAKDPNIFADQPVRETTINKTPPKDITHLLDTIQRPFDVSPDVEDVEDLRRPDLANADMQTGDWTYDPATGARKPVYNAIEQGAVPTPRISPLKQSPVMRTPKGDVPLWDPAKRYKPPTTADAKAMERNMQLAAFNTGTLVEPFSGLAGRKTGTKNHPSGNAIDVNIIDPRTGKAKPNFQNPESFQDYESYAMAVRKQQQEMNPELDDKLRWGGYFSNKGRPFGGMAVDQMHFDVNPKMQGQMALGSWDDGAKKLLADAYPGYGTDQPPSSYETAMNNVGDQTVMAANDAPPPKKTVARAIAPIAKKGIGAIKGLLDQIFPSEVAPATGPPIPRQKPRVPDAVAPATGIPIPRMKPTQNTQTALVEPTSGQAPAPAESQSLWQQYAPQKLQNVATAVNENVLQPIAESVGSRGVDRTQSLVNAKIANMGGGSRFASENEGSGGFNGSNMKQPIPTPAGDTDMETLLAEMQAAGLPQQDQLKLILSVFA